METSLHVNGYKMESGSELELIYDLNDGTEPRSLIIMGEKSIYAIKQVVDELLKEQDGTV